MWLGQVTNGQWEIRSRAVMPALMQVLNDLVDSGLVRTLSASASGKATTQFVVANRYAKGEPFPRREREKKDGADEGEEAEEEEELCDFELQRKRNIARNQELLRQLGLA